MKYGRLALITLRGTALYGAVGWGLLLFRDYFVYDGHHLPWALFIVLMGGTLGAAFSFAARDCLREIEKLKGTE